MIMSKKIATGIITIVTALILGATTWNFAATNGAVKKVDHDKVHERLEKKIDKMYDLVLDIYKRGK
jgi:coenzyme F420-reducing hydrogenase alpha subunit